jgi:DNA (cytosine-5)-methyltransferase 1
MRRVTIAHRQMTLTVGSLFSGIGGLDLGLERAGMKVIWQSEIDPYCNKVLKKHWPEVPNHGNIKDINWETVERPNVICGGYPCQPFSTAGKRRGTDDPRHLWPWVRTAISELRPDYAILENVRGHLSMGGIQVIGELAQIGYDAEWRVVSAAGLGAPHRRDRLIIVAYPAELFSNGSNNYAGVSLEPKKISELGDDSRSTRMADTYDTRSRTPNSELEQQGAPSKQERQTVVAWNGVSRRSTDMANTDGRRQQERYEEKRRLPVFSQVSTGKYDSQWEVEPDVGRVANGVPSRVDRLRGLGNAVVPQVAEYVGRLIVNAQ